MAKNAFRKFQGFVDKPKRNTFDLSFQNNLTCKFGDLVPVFCKEVIPGDSFRIDPTFGFRMMPMVFPIQTKINANLHFFYVRNRNLWKDWPDFIGKTKSGLTPPFLSVPQEKITTGSLYDYMGLPTTQIGEFGYTDQLTLLTSKYYTVSTKGHDADLSALLTGVTGVGNVAKCPFDNTLLSFGFNAKDVSYSPDNTWYTTFEITGTTLHKLKEMKQIRYITANRIIDPAPVYLVIQFTYKDRSYTFAVEGSSKSEDFESYNALWACENVERLQDKMTLLIENNVIVNHVSLMMFVPNGKPTSFIYPIKISTVSEQTNALASLLSSEVTDIKDLESSPYFCSDSPLHTVEHTIRINALPFRGYESIYNAFYRNQQNDPFKINGQVEYNKFIPNDSGGVDTTVYELHKRNWEKDYLTTCVQSPQQGEAAPLVGVTSTGTFNFEAADGTRYTAKAVVSEDGNSLTGIETMSPELNANGTGRMLVDMISHGISINDFRNVNALQRWLETNIRRGLRYKDQILSHFGVDPDYAAMDMPEFIGGMSRPVEISTVTQTSEGEDPLGSYAANGTVFGQGQSITKYCDEHGYIIGILSITPVPQYSQVLPKHFLKCDPLDYFFPEFGHIGMQPILYNEVCPVQAFYNEIGDNPVSPDVLHKEFGYQRAWYDYLGSIDEVHGLMRTSLRNFVMNRTFRALPELGKNFLQVDPRQINDVFADTDDTDKVIGIIDFRVSAKRPIPMYGIPRLE